MWNPWHSLAALTRVTLIWTRDLPASVLAATDGKNIWMDPDQLEAEKRCSLTHELIHIELGHEGCQTPAVERQVNAESARRLIPIESLAKAAAWTRDPDELAEELGVDTDTLCARISALDEAERSIISRAVEARGDAP